MLMSNFLSNADTRNAETERETKMQQKNAENKLSQMQRVSEIDTDWIYGYFWD